MVGAVESLSAVGLKYGVSSFDPRPYFVSRKSGGDVGAITTQIDDISGCGGPHLLLQARYFLGNRFGKLEVQGKSFVCVGVELSQEHDFCVTLTQEDFAENPKVPPRP